MKKYVLSFSLFFVLIFMSGCGNRSSTSMWENTKTASRYIGRGLKAFGGGGKDSRLIHYQYEFQGPEDAKYIALHEEGESDDTKSFPLAREVPGEMDSFLPGIEGFHNPVSKEATVFQNVHFDTNRDQVQGQNDIQIIKAISKFMKKNPNYYIYLEGHCDQRGTALYNMSLGSRRGNTVRNILIENGVDLDRLFTVSYGKEKLIDGSNNPAAWEKNRRVQFKLYKKN